MDDKISLIKDRKKNLVKIIILSKSNLLNISVISKLILFFLISFRCLYFDNCYTCSARFYLKKNKNLLKL